MQLFAARRAGAALLVLLQFGRPSHSVRMGTPPPLDSNEQDQAAVGHSDTGGGAAAGGNEWLLAQAKVLHVEPRPADIYDTSAPVEVPLERHDLQPQPQLELYGEARMFDYLFRNYRKQVRPVKDPHNSVNITVQLYLKQLLKINENDQVLTIYLWLEQYWHDDFLKWTPKDFDGFTSLRVPAELVWAPDLLIYNNANMNVGDNSLTTNAVVTCTGDVSLYKAMISDVACRLDMSNFPFDQQVCHIMLASWSYDGVQLALEVTGVDIITKHYVRNMEWALTTMQARRNTIGENVEKISLGVTALLSLAIILMMVSDKLPSSSEHVPLLGKYYIGLFMILFLATAATTVTLQLQLYGSYGKPMPKSFQKILKSSIVKLIVSNKLYRGKDEGRKKGMSLLERLSHNNRARNSRGAHLQNGDPAADRFVSHNNDDGGGMSGIRALLVESSACMAGPAIAQEPDEPRGRPDKMAFAMVRRLNDSGVLREIADSCAEIGRGLSEDRAVRRISREWERLARLIERVLMALYVTLTVSFCGYMILCNRQDDIVLTDKLMDSFR